MEGEAEEGEAEWGDGQAGRTAWDEATAHIRGMLEAMARTNSEASSPRAARAVKEAEAAHVARREAMLRRAAEQRGETRATPRLVGPSAAGKLGVAEEASPSQAGAALAARGAGAVAAPPASPALPLIFVFDVVASKLFY